MDHCIFYDTAKPASAARLGEGRSEVARGLATSRLAADGGTGAQSVWAETMVRWVRRWICGLAVISMVSCNSSGPGPSQTLNLAGTWSGTLFQPGSGTGGAPMTVTWAASQTGSSVSGDHTLVHPDSRAIAGTLAGTLTGSQLVLRQTVPRGNVPGFPDCSFVGTGSVTASAASISGTLSTMFTSCVGFNLNFPNGQVNATLALTKQ
jgi:hypothetical protein